MKNMLLMSLGSLLCFLYSCKKQVAVQSTGKIVKLSINATVPNDTLELVKEGKVIFQIGKTVDETISITIPEEGTEIEVRKKGSQEILTKRRLSSNSYNQKLSIIYENGKIYEKYINLKISAYTTSGVFEILVDDNVVPSNSTDGQGNPILPGSAQVPVEPGQKRMVKVRKRGETTILATKEILPDQPDQEFKFYHDGQQVINSIDVGPFNDRTKMLLTVRFKSTLPIYTGPVDLLVSILEYGVEKPTDMRIELPQDGSFGKALELPDISSNPKKPEYTAKIVKRGTLNELPYNTTNEIQPVKPLRAFSLTYVAGKARVLDITDAKAVRDRPASLKGTTFSNLPVDLSLYIPVINYK